MDSTEGAAEAEVYTCSGRTASSADAHTDKSPLRRTLRKYFENQPGVIAPAATSHRHFGRRGSDESTVSVAGSSHARIESLIAQKDDI
jgi:hypothetical protein